jgi:hypothetical protein
MLYERVMLCQSSLKHFGDLVGVHNTDLFIMALSVKLVLVWVFTMQIYLSWHFLLGLCWSGCSQYRFICLDTFCYACVGMDVENTCVRIL